MSVHKASLKCRLSYFVLIIFVIISIGFVVFIFQLSRHINEISEFEGKKAANDVINSTVHYQLDNMEKQEYFSVDRDENGKITSINTNTDCVNAVRNQISEGLNDSLKELENDEIKVPIGTLSGINLFTGRGADIPLKLHQIGGVKTEMKSEFSSAGINQTRYRLYIEISVEMSAILPAHSTDITVTSQYLINETIIVGDVPQMYFSE